MNTGNWNIVKEVFNRALELPEDQRGHYLQDACGGNEELLKDISGLLDSFDSEFMERPAIAEVAEFIVGDEDKLSAGDRLNHYRIVKLLGSGGMGEVYLAEDTKLNRQVAVKLLPPLSTTDPEANRRFLLEAQTAAELDHPHICTIHEIGESDGRSYIVMQYIKGETLAERIRRQPLTIKEALNFTEQIADALAEAHARGIIHRDIKPSNVIINPRGQAKVLDFSLARKTFVNSEDITQVGMSIPGMIVGTVSYMSPEQARGKTLDVRTDIWSLGVVLYEMLSGKLPFKGETSSDTIAAILRSDLPPLEETGREFPVELSQIVQKALAKSPDKRYQSAHEMIRDIGRVGGLHEAHAASYDADTVIDNISTRQQRYPFTGAEDIVNTASNTAKSQDSKIYAFPSFGFSKWLIAAGVLCAIVIPTAFIWNKMRLPAAGSPTNLVRTEITSWRNNLGMSEPGKARFSPDGKMIAFSSTRGGKQAIWLKQLNGGEPFTLKKTDDDSIDTDPVFSPDGQRIAFLSQREKKIGIYSAPTFGGTPVLLAEVSPYAPGLILWSRDGRRIYFKSKSNVYCLDLNENKTQQITNFGDNNQVIADFAISPDEKQIVFPSDVDGHKSLIVTSKDNPKDRVVVDATENLRMPIWHPDGQRIIYNMSRVNTDQIFESYLDGRPAIQLINDEISSSLSDVSLDGGKILYETSRDESDIWRVEVKTGLEIPVTSENEAEIWQSASPDGQKIVFQAFPDSTKQKILNSSIYVQPVKDGNKLKLTSDGYFPVWSPDGKKVAFIKNIDGTENLWVSSSTEQQLMQITQGGIHTGGFSLTPLNRHNVQDFQWSSDSQSIVYVTERDGVFNIWRARADGSMETQISDNIKKEWNFSSPMISPDGNRIAWIGQKSRNSDSKTPPWAIFLFENGKTEIIFSSMANLGLVGWAASGSTLIVKQWEGLDPQTRLGIANVSLYRMETDRADEPKLLANLKKCYIRNIVFSPTTREIAFVDRLDEADILRILPLEGGLTRPIVRSNDPQVYFSTLSWAPDGKSIYYGKHSNWTIISMLENLN